MCEMKYSHNILWDVEGSRVQLGLELIALGLQMILWYRGLWVFSGYRVHIWLEIIDIPRILGSECRGLWDKDSVGYRWFGDTI